MSTCGSTFTDTGEPCELPAGWGSDHDQWCKYHVEEELEAREETEGSEDGVVLPNTEENEAFVILAGRVYSRTHDPETDTYRYTLLD